MAVSSSSDEKDDRLDHQAILAQLAVLEKVQGLSPGRPQGVEGWSSNKTGISKEISL